MIKNIITISAILFALQIGWSQKTEVLEDLKKKVEVSTTTLKAFECNELDPLSLNATIIWSDDKSQLAVVMKTNLLYGWHIYSYVPKSQPYITTELELELPKGISIITDWIKPLDEAYDDGVYIFHGELVFIQYCLVNNINKNDTIKCGIYYQTCDLNKCYPPETKIRNFKLTY